MTLKELYIKLLDDDQGVSSDAYVAMLAYAQLEKDEAASDLLLKHASCDSGRYYLEYSLVKCGQHSDAAKKDVIFLPVALFDDDELARDYLARLLNWTPDWWTPWK